MKVEQKQHMNSKDQTARARVITRNREVYTLMTTEGVVRGGLSGRFQHSHDPSEYPVVGDWVLTTELDEQSLRIVDVLPRHSKFSRKEAGRVTNEQVLAANIDIVFIVTGLDHNFNISRILRYRTEVLEGGSKPVILLNKLDLCLDLEAKVTALRTALSDDPIHAVSTLTGEGMEAIRAYISKDTTVAFFGSSGVGKSSITNCLMEGVRMETGAVSAANGKGRHTTTTAELCFLPSGGMLIDTPGMRELQLWCQEDTVDESFESIAQIATQCRFENCKHQTEPGCAIKLAIKNGTLTSSLYRNFQNLKQEAKFFEAKQKQKEKMSQKSNIKTTPRVKRVVYMEE